MTNLDWKIAIRTFLNGRWYNLLNIAGLALGLAAFILVMRYVDHESGYDAWNKNAGRIFLVERELPTGASPNTPGRLAAAIKSQCAEVEETGRINVAPFELPFFTASGRFLVKRWVGADYSITGMLGIRPKGFALDPHSTTPTVLLSPAMAKALFPRDADVRNQTVTMLARSGGMPLPISGVAAPAPGNTSFTFDCIGFSGDITDGKDAGFGNPVFQTFLQVRRGTDIQALTQKIERIYADAALADSSQARGDAASAIRPHIFLDPLADLHLKPHYGSAVNAVIVRVLTILAILVLVVSGVNFMNLYIAQTDRRSREVGIKKLSGVSKKRVLAQFLAEILLQCLVALGVALVMVVITLPAVNRLLQVDLLLSGINLKIIVQVVSSLILLAALAGVYPAMIMAGFQPAAVLRGAVRTSASLAWLRHAVNGLQFALAIGFVIVLVVINRQVDYMHSEDPGFEAKQVICVDNMGIYSDPQKFRPVRESILAIPGVNKVTVASHVPGGGLPGTDEYSVGGQAIAMQTIGVDYDYFETLNAHVTAGEVFSRRRPSMTCAVINETAARAIGRKSPVGTLISGCGGTYEVIGMVRDMKAWGFEQRVQPTVYLMGGACKLSNTRIMMSVDGRSLSRVIAALGKNWKTIDPLDGDNFNYYFLDEAFRKLFAKQEQLRVVLLCFSLLALFIAFLGFFASAANAIRQRTKEIAIRKVFGAGARQLTATLSKPFVYHVLIANLLAWPVAFIAASRWLNMFVYRVQITAMPFAAALFVSVIVIGATVCLQVLRAVRFRPAEKLKM